MNYQKSRFDFQVNDINQANQVIQDFLRLNNYSQIGQSHYQFYDPVLIGKGNLEYYINGNQITILAYIGDASKPVPLDNSILLAMGKQGYLHKLKPLFENLSNNSGAPMNVNQNTQYGQPQQANYNQYGQPQQASNVFKSMKANNNKFAGIALAASIFNVILALCGIMLGIIPEMIIFYLAYLGTQSEKKTMAIVSIVINSLAMLITFILIIINLFA